MGYSGSVSLTANSVVGTSGKPIRLFAVNMLSTGTAGELILRNGPAITDDIWVREQGTIDTGKTVEYGTYGILFPKGCYYEDDGNFTEVIFQFSEES